MARMEERVGRRFGDPADPLLVSVRSGAPISMPGMMDTILNLGLNDATTAGLAARLGEREVRGQLPEAVRGDVPRHRRRSSRSPRTPGRSSARRSRRSSGPGTATGPGPTAQREGIPDDLGTAVTVQAMVFGNRSVDSGHGRPLHAQPCHRRAGPLRRRHVQRPGRGRRGRHPPHRADHGARRAAARRGRASCASTRRGSSTTIATSATSSSRSSTAGSGCSSAGSASAAPRRLSGSRSTWPRTPASRSRGPRRSSGSPRSSPTRRPS